MNDDDDETFTDEQVIACIRSWLEYGMVGFNGYGDGQPHGGYYSGGGWGARCLRYHLRQLEKTNGVAQQRQLLK